MPLARDDAETRARKALLMRRLVRRRAQRAMLLLACVPGGMGACVGPVRPPRTPSPAESTLAAAQLNNLLDARVAYDATVDLAFAARANLTIDAWPDISYRGARERAAFGRKLVRLLGQLDVNALSEGMYVSWLTLSADMSLLGQSSMFYETDLSSIAAARSPLRGALDVLGRDSVTNAASAEHHLFLLRNFAMLVDSVRGGLEARALHGIALSRVLLPRAAGFARALDSAVDSSEAHTDAAAAALDSAAQGQFTARLRTALDSAVHPAIARLMRYLEGAYATSATDRVGLWQYPGGKEHYGYLLRRYSTLDLTPEAAHTIGLREVERLEALAAEARTRAGLPSRRDSLRASLTSDARLALATPSAVLERVVGAYSTAASIMGTAFSRAAAYSADLQAMPRDAVASARLVHYVPPSVHDAHGHYLVNASRWQARSALTLAARTYADLLPGRHYQLALQLENDSLPPFRRLGEHAGFVDGWSMYAIALADSLVSGNDLDHLGAAMEQLSLACALVVDTGINYFGWSWNDALAFLRSHLPDADEDLEREILIPAVESPGSLTAAPLGAREFRNLRRWTEQELGPLFDLKAFHDEVMAVGSVPLPVLGKHLEWWIWVQKQRPVS